MLNVIWNILACLGLLCVIFVVLLVLCLIADNAKDDQDVLYPEEPSVIKNYFNRKDDN